MDFASLDWTAYDTGEVQAARRNAIGLRGQYLAEDKELREALTQIPAQHFYTVRRPASRADDAQALEGIKAEILSRLSAR